MILTSSPLGGPPNLYASLTFWIPFWKFRWILPADNAQLLLHLWWKGHIGCLFWVLRRSQFQTLSNIAYMSGCEGRRKERTVPRCRAAEHFCNFTKWLFHKIGGFINLLNWVGETSMLLGCILQTTNSTQVIIVKLLYFYSFDMIVVNIWIYLLKTECSW